MVSQKYLVQILEELNVPENALLASGDVTSMYSNCDLEGVLNTAREEFENSNFSYDIPKPSTEYFVKLLFFCHFVLFNEIPVFFQDGIER